MTWISAMYCFCVTAWTLIVKRLYTRDDEKLISCEIAFLFLSCRRLLGNSTHFHILWYIAIVFLLIKTTVVWISFEWTKFNLYNKYFLLNIFIIFHSSKGKNKLLYMFDLVCSRLQITLLPQLSVPRLSGIQWRTQKFVKGGFWSRKCDCSQ